MRQIIVDTETTGLKIEEGHRIIEIGCLELINRKLTGNHFHCYINPEREVEAAALAIHGICQDFLQEKPFFKQIANELIEFIKDAELIIHNAPFDVSFLNYELALSKAGYKSIADYCQVIDTLKLARQIHVGQRNSLDALCKRYSIDHSKRNLHGALLDAHLLAQVYLAMTGGQGNFFDAMNESHPAKLQTNPAPALFYNQPLPIIMATAEEQTAHQAYLERLKNQGKCLWLTD